MVKKINSLIALLLLTTTFNGYSMEQPPRGNNYLGWAAIVGSVLLGAIAIKMLWQSQPSEPFPFTDLPKEIQDQIILLLSLNSTATSLKEAVDTINSLAKVNHKLNKLINNPKFCLQIIKHLAIKFNYSNEQVAAELQTKESLRRLDFQHQLKILCTTPTGIISPIKDIPSLEVLCEQGIDLNFTYNSKIPKLSVTPLMMASIGVSNNAMLIKLCSMGSNLLNIDQRNENGDTALMLAIEHGMTHSNIKLLLDAGADPELANNNGLTPLQAAEKKWPNYPLVKELIQNAIEKKYEKK
jgi:ankyrin repeat protein